MGTKQTKKYCETLAKGWWLLAAAVSCSPDGARLGGAGLVSGTTGKPGRAWVGAWRVDVGGLG